MQGFPGSAKNNGSITTDNSLHIFPSNELNFISMHIFVKIMTIYVALAIMFLFRMVIIERSQSIPGEDQNTLHKDKSAEGN